MILNTLLVISAYLLGSISSAILVCRIMGLPDPRTEGSKNPGATNVLRFGSKKAAGLTLAGDALKGLIPVLIAKAFSVTPETLALVAVAAFLGHLYPVFFGFKGGKGVATALGVFLGLSFPVGIVLLLTWLVIAYITKISSLSALIAATLAPFYIAFLMDDSIFVIMAIFISGVLMYRHRSNIRDLLSGKEGKITDKNS